MQLSVLERLTLLSMLPERGALTTVKIVNELRQELSFDEEEHAALAFHEDGNQLRWNKGIPDKNIDIGRKATGIICDLLAALDEQEKITAQHLPLCDKFDYPGE